MLTADIIPIHQGASKTALVECIKLYAEGENYDEIWCVFDMDEKPGINGQAEGFNHAIALADKEGYKCAYSNDAFELWFVLHYQYVDQEQLRTFYFKTLGIYWNINYEKHGKERKYAQLSYQLLLSDVKASQEDAIRNAHKLFESQKHKPCHLQNPVTTVYKLVEALNLHLRN